LWSDATRQLIASRHSMGKRIGVEHALDGLDIPLHPGAERYYKEIGLQTSAKQ
jgi:TRAP-type uncharacterized transport system substrate-binding protein